MDFSSTGQGLLRACDVNELFESLKTMYNLRKLKLNFEGNYFIIGKELNVWEFARYN